MVKLSEMPAVVVQRLNEPRIQNVRSFDDTSNMVVTGCG